jgi:hypothetical protein
MINLTQHQKRHPPLQKEMTLYFQECAESPPSVDPIHTAILTIDATALSSNDKPVDKYIPEKKSFKAVLKLDDDIWNAWLHAIKMEIENLINHNTFKLGKTPCKDELTIPVKLVLKAKQNASGKLEKLKANIVAQCNMKKTKNTENQSNSSKLIQKQTQENAENKPAITKTNTIPIEIPQPFEDTWSPCASSRGVKLLISTTCASHCTLKSGDFIGGYLQAKVIGRLFVRFPLEYAYYFPEYAK